MIQLYVSGRYVSGNRVICDNFARIGFQTFRFRIGLTPVWVLGSHVAQAQRGHAIHNRLGTGRKTAVITELIVERNVEVVGGDDAMVGLMCFVGTHECREVGDDPVDGGVGVDPTFP